MQDLAADACSPDDHCITCGDEGVAMEVVSIEGAEAICLDPEREEHPVATDLVGPVVVGDQVLVHAGVAIRHLSLGHGALESGSSAG
jgi:hydrogenase maturation factor